MNIVDFTYLLEHPNQINSAQTAELEKILHDFPYLQSARAIYLKGLFNEKNYHYNTELKIVAAYSTNRTILFNFITSKNFKTNFNIDTDKKDEISKVEKAKENSESNIILNTNTLEQSLIKSINEADFNFKKNIINWEPNIGMIEPDQQTDFIDKATNLNTQENEKLVEFNSNESHSFSQWLKITKIKPIVRNEDETKAMNKANEDNKNNKFELIDKFIETNPKISSAKAINANIPVNVEKSNQENAQLMTETLAKIYLQQKKYQKAIQAYEILILKYPEKSSLFAERIIEIKKIQNNNN